MEENSTDTVVPDSNDVIDLQPYIDGVSTVIGYASLVPTFTGNVASYGDNWSSWKNRKFKPYSTSWGGNGYTGGKNAAINFSKRMAKYGKGFNYLATAVGLFDLGYSYYKNDFVFDRSMAVKIGHHAGGIVGGYIFGKVGARLGFLAGTATTGVGGLVGAGVGGLTGAYIGSKYGSKGGKILAGYIYDRFNE